ncbi:hypothetical protein Tco_0199876 [Tanacetum coccineum]
MSPRRSEGEESEYPFFEGDGSSSDEWRDYGIASDDYEGPSIFDDDQYEIIIEEEEEFVDNYPNFQKDETNMPLRMKNDLLRKEDLVRKKTTWKTL